MAESGAVKRGEGGEELERVEREEERSETGLLVCSVYYQSQLQIRTSKKQIQEFQNAAFRFAIKHMNGLSCIMLEMYMSLTSGAISIPSIKEFGQ